MREIPEIYCSMATLHVDINYFYSGKYTRLCSKLGQRKANQIYRCFVTIIMIEIA